MVSKIYHFLLVTDLVKLPIERVWESDCPDITQGFKWGGVWSSINEASRKPDHQHIHFNFLHRTYLTPVRLHHMKVINNPLCNLCSLQARVTFIHMFWDCLPVGQFWSNVTCKLSALLQITVPVSASVLVLNDRSTLPLSKLNKRVVFCWVDCSQENDCYPVKAATLSYCQGLNPLFSGRYIFGALHRPNQWCQRADS